MTRWLLFAMAFVVCGACSLNPQPFPPAPDNDPRTGLTNDGGGSGSDSGTLSLDSGMTDDAGGDLDSGYDAGIDAPSDASSDAPIDAPVLDADSDALLGDN